MNSPTPPAREIKQPNGPWTLRGTSINFANVAGGFDVRNCPDPESLAAFIHAACNSHDALKAERDSAEAQLAYIEPRHTRVCEQRNALVAALDRLATEVRAIVFIESDAKMMELLADADAALRAARGDATTQNQSYEK